MLTKRSKKARGVVDRQAEARKKSGLYSLLVMVAGILVAIAIGVFLYLSPLFNHKKNPELNQTVEVTPLPESSNDSYQFYEALPNQQFYGVSEGLSVQERSDYEEQSLPVDVVIDEPADKTVSETGTDETDDNNDELADTAFIDDHHLDEPSVMQIERSNPDMRYILQVRSYDNADDADHRRGEVIMAGVDAIVVKRTINGERWYQVVSTPMATKDEALANYNRLKSNGIDAVVIEIQ